MRNVQVYIGNNIMFDKNKHHQDAIEIAKAYDESGELYHQTRVTSGRLFNEFLEIPATLSLLPDKLSTLKVLDAGCGSGLYAKKLAKDGAEVIGVDISQVMIDIAKRETPEDLNIDYRVGDLYQLNKIANNIDLIICSYVLENIDDITSIFKEFYSVLKPEGICIFSISHPIRAMAVREKIEEKEIWKLENYFERGMRISDFGHGLKVKKYKRTISDYLMACIKAGFKIENFVEPQPIKDGETRDPAAYKIAMELPQLLVIKMRKI